MYLIAMTFGIIILPNIITNLLQSKLFTKPHFSVSKWLAFAAALQFSISVIYAYNYNQYMNFVMHAIGGGVACSLMFRHIKNELDWKISGIEEWMFLFGFVCAFGVMNEIAEASLDFIGFGIFSINRTDTWLDLIANTLGGFISQTILFLVFNSSKSAVGKK